MHSSITLCFPPVIRSSDPVHVKCAFKWEKTNRCIAEITLCHLNHTPDCTPRPAVVPPAATSTLPLHSRVVEAVADGEKYLKVGDTVVSQFDQNWGGLAEYAVAKSGQCARNPPPGLSPAEAAALASSGAAAVVIARHVRRGDRVLVIGGSGGVGTFLVQLARARGASFVAAVSTQTELMQELGADRAIDYREEAVWTSTEFQAEGDRFDVVVDLVEKGWDRVMSPEGRARPIVKTGWKGGRFVTTVRPWIQGWTFTFVLVACVVLRNGRLLVVFFERSDEYDHELVSFPRCMHGVRVFSAQTTRCPVHIPGTRTTHQLELFGRYRRNGRYDIHVQVVGGATLAKLSLASSVFMFNSSWSPVLCCF